MSHVTLSTLKAAARGLAGGGTDDADLHAIVAGVELGALAEADPGAARALAGALDAIERQLVATAVRCQWGADLARLEARLAEAEAEAALLALPAVFTSDPAAAEALQRRALDAVVARERLERQGHALAVLEGVEPPDVAVDARLHAAVRGWHGLAPALAGLAEELGASPSPARFWLVPPEAPWMADDDGDEPLAPLMGWLRARVSVDRDGARLRLDADEARALLATEEGRCLAEHLGEQLDVSAAARSDSELAAAVAALAPAAGWRTAVTDTAVWLASLPGALASVARDLAGRTAERPPVVAALAATAHAAPSVVGFDAIAQFFALTTSTEVGLGVVSVGLMRSEADPDLTELGVLVVPEESIRSLRLGPASEPVDRGAFARGGLLWPRAVLGAEPVVLVTRDGGREEEASFEAFEPATTADPLTVVLRAMSLDSLAVARALLEAATASVDDGERRALSGLLAALSP